MTLILSGTNGIEFPDGINFNDDKLLAGDGYQRLPGGLIIQWGTYPNTASGTKTFPIAFPTLCAACALTPRTGTDADIVTALTTANFQWANGGSSTPNGYFIAIGY